MTHADRTYMNIMIFKTIASTKGRSSVKQIHAAIAPNMGISIRSLQRYLNGLAYWGWWSRTVKHHRDLFLLITQRIYLKTWPTDVMHDQHFAC